MSTNPFEEDPIASSGDFLDPPCSKQKHQKSDDPDSLSTGGGGTNVSGSQQSHQSYDHMAKRLLEDNFILTALEFHAELLESGRELRRLRDYFSNPVHFESVITSSSTRLESLPITLPRTSSAQTLDSLDYTRYSEDGDRQTEDRVAVLEFELRKAKDTIRSLREQLTVASESRTLTRDGESNDTLTHVFTGGGLASTAAAGSRTFSIDGHNNYNNSASSLNIPLKPHEERALNFLVHEFLLRNGHKLTAVAFSDEVDDQDFEDWDDVGLNVPRPPDLHIMYREFYYRIPGYIQRKDVGCSANVSADDNSLFQSDGGGGETELLNKLNDENATLLKRNQQLESELERLSNQICELQKDLTTATVTSMPSRTPDAAGDRHKSISPRSAVLPATNDRTVPNWLKEKVLAKTAGGGRGIQAQLHFRIVSSSEELVTLLAVALPRIIPNVLLNKREELISPLLNVVAFHPDSRVRDQLLMSYFGLIKRPDDDQRQLLVSACIAYVKGVGAVRAETELLPLCWEQMNHKYVERRLLIAEICGGIIPYLPPSISSSLILSMLQQMLTEDKSELVREAVVRSLAVLTIFAEDRDKFGQVFDLSLKALSDQCEQVVSSATSVLVPCLGCWSSELGQFQTTVIGTFVKRIAQLINAIGGANKATSEQLLCNYFTSLRSLTTLLFWSVLRSGPYWDRVDDESTTLKNTEDDSATLELTRLPAPDGVLDDLAAYFPDKRQLLGVLALYDEWTGREWYQTWDLFDFVVKEMFPQLIASLGKLDASLHKMVHVGVDYFRHFVKVFGRGFSVTKIRPVFSATMTLENSEGTCDLTNHPLSYAALPIYSAGVLGAHHTDADKKELKTFLKTAIVAVASANGASPTSILSAFTELSITYPDTDLVLSVIWDLITHKSIHVRRICALILCRLIRTISDVGFLRSKLVPALITLASDREMPVRASTIVGFGAVLETSSAHEDIMEKVRMQLGAMLDEPQSSEVTVQIIRTFAQIAPNLETKFRDEFVLPQMAVLCARNNALGNGDTKSVVASALLDAYSALSCCYLSHTALVESFLPGLKGLLKDLDLERAKVAKSIIRDVENKVAAANSVERGNKSTMLGPTEMAVDEMKVKMMTKFRDFKDKMDQHKENVPQLFKKK